MGFFDNPYGKPPTGGLLGYDPSSFRVPDYAADVNAAVLANAAKPPVKPGFFDKGGIGSNIGANILGNIGDMMLRRVGLQPSYGQSVQHQQQMEEDEQKYERRQQAMLDWMARQQQQPDPSFQGWGGHYWGRGRLFNPFEQDEPGYTNRRNSL